MARAGHRDMALASRAQEPMAAMAWRQPKLPLASSAKKEAWQPVGGERACRQSRSVVRGVPAVVPQQVHCIRGVCNAEGGCEVMHVVDTTVAAVAWESPICVGSSRGCGCAMQTLR